MPRERVGRTELDVFLDRYNVATGAEQPAISAEIMHRFSKLCAVFVLDLSGFSKGTRAHGIVHILARIRQLHVIADPVLARHDGIKIKGEADDLFAIFPDPKAAVDAAIALNGALSRNAGRSASLKVKIGIAYGPVILVDGHDLYGGAVNIASKLGEDLATAGEILVDQSAHDAIEDLAVFSFQRREFSRSNVLIKAYKVLY